LMMMLLALKKVTHLNQESQKKGASLEEKVTVFLQMSAQRYNNIVFKIAYRPVGRYFCRRV